MKVVLIIPSLITDDISFLYKRFSPCELSLSVGYLAAILIQSGIEVRVIDQNAKKISNHAVSERIEIESPDIVGISCVTLAMGNILHLVKGIQALKKNIKVILGNIHPTLFADDLLKKGFADIIVRGEGENSLREVVKSLEGNGVLDGIKGISFLKNDEVFHNPEREQIEDLDALPYPAWNLFDFADYSGVALMGIRELSLPIISSRGCLWKCKFCAKSAIFKNTKFRKISKVVDEMEYMFSRYKIRVFNLHDAAFPISREQAQEFCNEIISRGLNKYINWTSGARVDLLDEDLLILMKKSGLSTILYGIESGSQKVLDSVNKNINLNKIIQVIKITKKLGISTYGNFILGFPGETKETCEITIAFSKKLNCDISRFGIFVPYPGSQFFKELKTRMKDNIYDYEKFDPQIEHNSRLLYVPEAMTENELINLQRKAILGFYLRPSFILSHLIKRTFRFKDLCYGILGLIIKGYKFFIYILKQKIFNK